MVTVQATSMVLFTRNLSSSRFVFLASAVKQPTGFLLFCKLHIVDSRWDHCFLLLLLKRSGVRISLHAHRRQFGTASCSRSCLTVI